MPPANNSSHGQHWTDCGSSGIFLDVMVSDPFRLAALKSAEKGGCRWPNRSLTEVEVSKRLRVTVACVRRWRLERRGPRYFKVRFLVRYRGASQRHHGRPGTAVEIRRLIERMAAGNPPWRAPRIHGELKLRPLVLLRALGCNPLPNRQAALFPTHHFPCPASRH